MGVLPDWMLKRDVKIEPFAEAIKRDGKISFGCGSYGYDMRVGFVFDVFSPINATEIDPKKFDSKALVRVDLTPEHNHRWEYLECLDKNHESVMGQHCVTCGAWKGTPSEQTQQCPTHKPNYILIPPHSFALAESVETFDIPRDTLCIVIGKSTYARCGLIVNCTPLEPEWRGKVTIELSNTTHLPLRVYCGEGIAQCIFFRTDGYRELATEDIKNTYNRLDNKPLDIHWLKNIFHGATCHTSYADKKGRYQDQTGLTLPSVDKAEIPDKTS